MARRPLVLVTTDTMSASGLDWSACQSKYYDALAHVGLTPVLMPALRTERDLSDALDAAAGVLLTGAKSNVHPSRYGAPAIAKAEPFDSARDALSFSLIAGANERNMPIFGICRGHQELNVAYGGTLIARYHERPGLAMHFTEINADIDVWFGLKHIVTVQSGGLLGCFSGAPLDVNSVHTQAVDRVGDGLTVEARAPDGTVEAISDPNKPFVLGVQWHPEVHATTNENARIPFALFADAVQSFATGTRKAAA